MNRAWLLATAVALGVETAAAQTPPDTVWAAPEADRLEAAAEREGSEVEAERLAWLMAHPVPLNTASAEDLAQIPGLSLALAHRIVAFRSERGPFAEVEALARLEGLTPAAVAALAPYLTVAAPPRRRLRGEVLQRFTRRLDLGRGYRPTADSLAARYLGTPERLLTRLTGRYGPWEAALVLDKDPGERLRRPFEGRTLGMDFATASLGYQGAGLIEVAVLGDFALDFGRGLVLGRAGVQGKGPDPVSPLVRAGRGLAPHRSSEENRFFRGAGATLRLHPSLRLTAAFSRRRLDAALAGADTLGRPAFTERFDASGLHRTPAELARKDAARVGFAGGVLELTRPRWQVGAVGYTTRFAQPLHPEARPDLRFAFAGTSLTAGGLYGHLALGRTLVLADVVASRPGPWGGLVGLDARSPAGAEVVLALRAYPPRLAGPYGAAFGEQDGSPRNEQGLYAGLRLPLNAHWTLAGYADLYRFPWLRFGQTLPAGGADARLRLSYAPRPWLSLLAEARAKSADAAVVLDERPGAPRALGTSTRQEARLQGDYAFSHRLSLRLRLDVAAARLPEAPRQRGTLLLHDVRLTVSPAFTAIARLALFDTDGYAARLYAYEHDLLYAFSVPALAGRGRRAYLLLRAAPTARLTLEAKAALLALDDVTSLGSGLDETPGRRQREIRLQVRGRW